MAGWFASRPGVDALRILRLCFPLVTTTHPNAFTGVRRLASGKHGAFLDGILVYRSTVEAEATQALDFLDEPGTCSICDGIGHGYPGAGPCPLEETGEDDPRERALWALNV